MMEFVLTIATAIAVRAILIWAPAIIVAIVMLRRRHESQPFRILSAAMILGVLLDIGYHALITFVVFPGEGAEGP